MDSDYPEEISRPFKRGVVVSEAFLYSAIELAEAMRILAAMTNPNDVCLTLRETWEKWEKAANTVLGERK